MTSRWRALEQWRQVSATLSNRFCKLSLTVLLWITVSKDRKDYILHRRRRDEIFGRAKERNDLSDMFSGVITDVKRDSNMATAHSGPGLQYSLEQAACCSEYFNVDGQEVSRLKQVSDDGIW